MAIPIIGDLINSVINKAGDIVGQVVVDKDKKIQLANDLERLRITSLQQAAQFQHDELTAQTDINKAEANNGNVFVSGWRPAIGWIGAAGLGYSFILNPMGSWVANVVFKYTGAFPQLDTATLMVLVTGMLGFGGLRTYEKSIGVSESPPENKAGPGTGPTDLLPASFDDLPEEAPWSK